MKFIQKIPGVWIFLGISLLFTCSTAPDYSAKVSGENITIYFNDLMHSTVTARFEGKETLIGPYSPSEFITIEGKKITDFQFSEQENFEIEDQIGKGKQFLLTGQSGTLKKEVRITLYEDFPRVAVFNVKYTNTGDTEINIERWTNNHYTIEAGEYGAETPPLWSYQSGSYASRPDWVLPIHSGFKQENDMGMNASDYGGGTPVVDVWRKDVGIGVGHLELVPKLVSLPVNMPDTAAAGLSVQHEIDQNLNPGESLSTLETFTAVHQGDYFQVLVDYRKLMIEKGIHFDEYPESTYEPIWCAWGYERDFTIDQIYNTLPIVKELGYKWVVLDDGWQTSEGDWYLNRQKFPRGDKDMIKLVNKIKEYGLKAKLWWAPLAVDPGTDLIEEHPEYLLLNKDGSKQRISWWDAYYLCPSYPPVQEYTKKLVEKFMGTWGYEGLKIDGQHLNAAPPCYNPAHNHKYPEEAFEQIPEFFKVIYETALSIHPDAVVEICPCGTAYAFHTMPFMNQPVASDPESSWQIRTKGKTFKALMGFSAPYYGDHVELSDGRDDFASTVGIGGVVGTKFTWPVGAKKDSKIDLTEEKEKRWKKWNEIYLDKMLPKGMYLGNLYDIGYYRPEAHAIQKDDKMYYSFYADDYRGNVELRGMETGIYKVYDYINEKDYGTVNGPQASIPVHFQQYLLLEAVPQ